MSIIISKEKLQKALMYWQFFPGISHRKLLNPRNNGKPGNCMPPHPRCIANTILIILAGCDSFSHPFIHCHVKSVSEASILEKKKTSLGSSPTCLSFQDSNVGSDTLGAYDRCLLSLRFDTEIKGILFAQMDDHLLFIICNSGFENGNSLWNSFDRKEKNKKQKNTNPQAKNMITRLREPSCLTSTWMCLSLGHP